jgi:HK97 gp10 family phage protein
MSKNDVEVSGFEEISRNLQALGDKKNRVENRAVRAGAEIVAEKMREIVAVSDIKSAGYKHIKDDIQISGIRRAKEGTPIVMVGPGKETAWRAKFLEFGTINMPPQAFISVAAQLTATLVQAAIVRELRRGLGLL